MSLIVDNPYFSAGFGLIGVGAGVALLRRGLVVASSLVRRRFVHTMEVTSRDALFQHVLAVLARSRPNAWNGHHYQIGPAGSLHPGQGTHYLRYGGHLLKMDRNRERSAIDVGSANPMETVTVSWVGDANLPRQLLHDARAMAEERESGKLVIYTHFASEWRPFGQPRRKRPLESVVLEEGLMGTVVQDLSRFLQNSHWYYERGIPYRRGYLLYGPPGGGKSSLIQALASHFDYGVCLLSLGGDAVVSDDRLQHLCNNVPPKTFLLLEDVDATAPSRTGSAADPQMSRRLTLSGLLNAIDGVAAAEERIIFMTTNHKERLDPALIRPGRVDLALQLGLATAEQAANMFCRFYPQATAAHVDAFARSIAQCPRSPAEIQGIFITSPNSPLGALQFVAGNSISSDEQLLPSRFG